MAYIYAIEQQVSTGSNFNGQLPTTQPTDKNGVWVYPEDTQGGYFALPDTYDQPACIEQLNLHLGGQASWYCELYNPETGETFRVLEGTTEGFYLWIPYRPLLIPVKWAFRIFTEGATQAMRALVFIKVAYQPTVKQS